MTKAIRSALLLVCFVSIAEAQSPTAQAPILNVGDEWRYTGGLVRKVIAIEDGRPITTATPNSRCPECRYHLDANLTVVSVTDREGKPAYDTSAGLKLLEFPLEIGKKWTSHQDLFSQKANRTMPYDNFLTVEDYGDVKTKAGTFKAFKIAWRQENRGPYPWTGRATLWYSPDVKAFVKREVHTTEWFQNAELETFTLK